LIFVLQQIIHLMQ